MSQHDYVLANAAGAAFRSDANDALAAIATNNSGTAPSTTYAYMWWADTATGMLKQRNAANSGWIVWGPLASPLPRRGHLAGMGLANNGSDATNDIDFAVGECADSTNTVLIRATSALTKQLDATWAAGNNAGGRMSAAGIANTTYHCYAILKDSDGTVDFGFDTSATSPTMPSGYTYFRRIGSIVRASAAIKAFVQDGDYFQWSTPVADIAATNPGTSAVTRTLTVPVGINVLAELQLCVTNSGTGGSVYGNVSDLATSDRAPSAGAADTSLAYNGAGGAIGTNTVRVVRTNTSAQIRSRLSFSDGSVSININTLGWFDRRGRDA